MKGIIIAIDGFSSTGKSTLAKQLAYKLNFTYVDSGAMYRAITLYFLDHHIELSDNVQIAKALEQIVLTFIDNKITLNGEPVDEQIRSMAIANLVSEVAALKEVRKFAVAQQQALGEEKAIVMDGRDIGTTVFPKAELKIYLTADEHIRAMRRYDEMKRTNPSISLDEVVENLKHRDLIDSTRDVSPLRKAKDAVILDNTALTMEQQLEISYQWAIERMQA
ncbi:MAG: (d)CMP kinase [Chitinophagaceae bacterium]|jgi:cytidylate kinase|nr:(d)CMP kinase [Chitinophagaceae bacterium]